MSFFIQIFISNLSNVLSKNESNSKHDDFEQDDDKMEEDSDENDDEILGQKSAGSIYCSICKEIFLEARSLAKHIIKEHCSKGSSIRLNGETFLHKKLVSKRPDNFLHGNL